MEASWKKEKLKCLYKEGQGLVQKREGGQMAKRVQKCLKVFNKTSVSLNRINEHGCQQAQ